MECGARRRNGELCRAQAMQNGRCRIHGGATPGGLASPHLSAGGKYSKYLPTRLVASYEAALKDPDLIATRHEVALLESRLQDLLAKGEVGEAGEWARTLRKLMRDYQKAEEKERAGVLADLFYAIEAGAQDYQIWGEIRETIEQRRRCTETERKRLVDMQQMISSERALLLVARVGHIIRQHVHDKKELAAISYELGGIYGPDAGCDRRSTGGGGDPAGGSVDQDQG